MKFKIKTSLSLHALTTTIINSMDQIIAIDKVYSISNA